MISILVFILTILLSHFANAGPYTEIPKLFAKDDQKAKSFKIGYNLTNNLNQKQSLFFVEGILKNENIYIKLNPYDNQTNNIKRT